MRNTTTKNISTPPRRPMCYKPYSISLVVVLIILLNTATALAQIGTITELENTNNIEYWVQSGNVTDLNTKNNLCNSNTGCTIKVPSGTYNFSAVSQIITVKSHTTYQCIGQCIFNITGSSADIMPFYYTITNGANYDVTTDVERYATQIPVSDGTAFKNGDLIIIKDNISSSNHQKGEYVIVTGVNGNTLNISDPLDMRYDTSNNASVRLINPVENVKILGNFHIIHNDSQSGHLGIRINGFKNLEIAGLTIKDMGSTGIHVSKGYLAKIHTNEISGVKQSGTGYGISIGPSRHVEVYHNNIYDVDEGIDHNGGVANIDGWVDRTNIHHNTISNAADDCIDTHSMVLNVYIHDNTLFDCGATFGIQGDGGYPRVENNLIYETTGRCIDIQDNFQNTGENDTYYLEFSVRDNKCYNNGPNNAINIAGPKHGGTIIGNEIYNHTGTGSHYAFYLDDDVENVTIANNYVYKCRAKIFGRNDTLKFYNNYFERCEATAYTLNTGVNINAIVYTERLYIQDNMNITGDLVVGGEITYGTIADDVIIENHQWELRSTSNAQIYLNATAAGAARLRMMSTTNDQGTILFGDPGDADVGSIMYDHSSDELSFEIQDSIRAYFDWDGKLVLGQETGDAKEQLDVIGSINTTEDIYVKESVISSNNQSHAIDFQTNGINISIGDGHSHIEIVYT